MSYRMGKVLDKFQSVLCSVDKKCMVCQADVFLPRSGFCECCQKTCVANNKKTCVLCGSAFAGDSEFCSHCTDKKMFFDKAYSAFVFEGGIASAIYKVKFGHTAAYCKMLAQFLVFLQQKNQIEFDVVCYVPMTKKKQKQRGYNQARVLAEYFCDFLEIDCLSHCLKKIRETENQEKLGRVDRIENVKNAFDLVENSDIKGKIVLLIDDVKTTGTTFSDCARALKKGGAKRVVCLSVASRPSEF